MSKQEGAQKDDRKGGYELPVCDTQTERRNFPGYEKKSWVTLDEWRNGDWAGSSDTDSETDDRKDNPRFKVKYTKLNSKGGRPKMRPYKSSSQHSKDN